MSVFGSREEEVMMTLYKSFVRSQLEYCSLLWHPQKIGDIELIEGVQRNCEKAAENLRRNCEKAD